MSSFMVWVAADGEVEEPIEGGGTEFPYLKKDSDDSRWCRFVKCQGTSEREEATSGVTFKPVAGNAVFWQNFRADDSGRGYEETLHAGLPVIKGVKVGLNIWSWGRIGQ